MTEEQVKAWIVERDIARQSGRDDLMQLAYDHRDDMMMTCISHQAERVKAIRSDVDKIKKDLEPCVESDKEFRLAKERAKGVSLFFNILKWLFAAGLGGTAIEIIKAFCSK